MEFPPETSTSGVLHYIPPDLSAFEPTKALARTASINTLIWVGGMFDTLQSVSYPFKIGPALGPTWSLVTTSLGSAGLSWGVGSIAQDAADMGRIVNFIKARRPGGKIVLMGHSTGCQDCMEYVVGRNAQHRPAVDGIILQAPVSDRQVLEKELPQAVKHEADQHALKMLREGHGKDALPNRMTKQIFGRIAITADRWIDISSPGPSHNGKDDYFSSDLPTERLEASFGKVNVPLLVLYSGADDGAPENVDMTKVLQTWTDVVQKSSVGKIDQQNSGIVPGASHNLNGDPDESVQNLVQRVVNFIDLVDRGVFE